MVDMVREIERKYVVTGGTPQLPDLTGVAGVSAVLDKGTTVLDATYYDTAEGRLAADGITLRRRTGGSDAGWHLKLPVEPGVRDEVQAPLVDDIPRRLTGLVRSRVRDAELVPVVGIVTDREVHQLLGEDGEPVAEIAVDRVRAECPVTGRTAEWTEVEVELAEGRDPAVLDAVEAELGGAGLRRSWIPSKLARALAETSADAPGKKGKKGKQDKKGNKDNKDNKDDKATGKKAKEAEPAETAPATAGDHVLDYVRTQVTAIVELDPAVRLDAPDSVHRMRVATRRLRSAFRSYGKVLDRAATDPVGEELKWLAGELGIDRDREVLTERIHARLGELDRPLLQGPVRGRLRTWSAARRQGSRRRLIAVLDGHRYLALLQTLDALLADPPLRAPAARPPEAVLPKAVLRDYERLADLVEKAVTLPAGQERDLTMHESRKAAKRTRYAAETARAALGKPAKRFAARMTEVQDLLGDHQDSVVARGALREIAAQAHAAGESAFTYGVMYAREEARAARLEDRLPELWTEVSGAEHRLTPRS